MYVSSDRVVTCMRMNVAIVSNENKCHVRYWFGGCVQLVYIQIIVKCKGLPQEAEVALGVPGRLRPRIFLTFGTTRVVGCQPYAPAAFTLGEIPGTHF